MAFKDVDDVLLSFDQFERLDDGEQCKEVYAHYGLSAYVAQCLEVELVNATLLVRRVNGEIPTLDKWDLENAKLGRKTMGGLIRMYRAAVGVSPEEEEALIAALNARNELAHGFFYEHAGRFMVTKGRYRMLRKMLSLRQTMVTAHEPLEQITSRLAKKVGVDESVKLAAEVKLMREVYEEDFEQ